MRPIHPALISLVCSSQISLLKISPELSECLREIEGYLKGGRERRKKGGKEERKKDRRALWRDGLARNKKKRVKTKDNPRTES